MVRELVVKPDGWKCTLEECNCGLFVYKKKIVGVKVDSIDGSLIAYDSFGEEFWGNAKTDEERKKLLVTPCIVNCNWWGVSSEEDNEHST